MERKPVQISGDQFIERMQALFQQAMREVADAVNKAPDGQWISGSEMRVFETLGEFRRKAYETALQMRVDESQGAFSPGGPRNAQKDAEQRPAALLAPEHQRENKASATPVSLPRTSKPHAGR